MSGESSTMHTNVRPDGTARTIYKYQSGTIVYILSNNNKTDDKYFLCEDLTF